jgi:uncharacterized protein YbjT (DUF2867 family)
MTNDDHTFLVAGGTGLVGRQVVDRLLAFPFGPRVITIGRRAFPAKHPCLVSLTADLSNPNRDSELTERLGNVCQGHLDAFLCTLGTTRHDAGSAAAFRTIDLDLVVRLAGIARNLGAGRAVLVSAVNVDPESRSVYLRTKGELEQRICELGFTRCDFLRPSVLIGKRGGHYRLVEHMAQVLAPLYNPLLQGGLRRFRAIHGETVAAAVVELAGNRIPGVYVHNYDSICELADVHTAGEVRAKH